MRQKTIPPPPTPAVDSDCVICVGLSAGRTNAEPVLRGLDLELSPGMALWITGASGAGKSLLLACLMGRVRALEGELRLFGAPVTTQAQRLAARQRIGFVAQAPVLADRETVHANITLAAKTNRLGATVAPTDIEALIRYFGLEAYARLPAGALPPGRRRLAALACAAVRKPDLLLIDTPFADLDRTDAQRTAHLLTQLQSLGAAVIVTAAQADPNELRHWPTLRLEHGRLALTPLGEAP